MTRDEKQSNGNAATELAFVHKSIDPYFNRWLVVFPGGMQSEWLTSEADANKLAHDYNIRVRGGIKQAPKHRTFDNEGQAMSFMRMMNQAKRTATGGRRADLCVVVASGTDWVVTDLRTAINAGVSYTWEV
jgi:hypothetical protein